MEPTPFDLTPAQKGLLVSLSHATGKPVPVLIEEALDAISDPRHEGATDAATTSRDPIPASPPARRKPIWEVAAELFADIPEEELARLPEDGAAQHDHYIYGTPKRPS